MTDFDYLHDRLKEISGSSNGNYVIDEDTIIEFLTGFFDEYDPKMFDYLIRNGIIIPQDTNDPNTLYIIPKRYEEKRDKLNGLMALAFKQYGNEDEDGELWITVDDLADFLADEGYIDNMYNIIDKMEDLDIIMEDENNDAYIASFGFIH